MAKSKKENTGTFTPYTLQVPKKMTEPSKDIDGNECVNLVIKNQEQFSELMDYIIDDNMLQKFMQRDYTKRFICSTIGVKGLLDSFKKEEILAACTWEMVKEYFTDHMNVEDILNHIGWETVKEHFADRISVNSTASNSINTSDTPVVKKGKSVLGALSDDKE